MSGLLYVLTTVSLLVVQMGHAHARTHESVVAINLSGDAVVPSVNSTATGTMAFAYNDMLDAIYWTLDIFNPDQLNLFGGLGGHIHCGSSTGFNGPIVVTLQPSVADNRTEIGLTGNITQADIEVGVCVDTIPSLWNALSSTFGAYVNIHSTENPTGEIRGDFRGGPIVAEAEVVIAPMTTDTVVPPPVNSSTTGYLVLLYSRYLATMVFSMEIDNPGGVELFGSSTGGASLFCGSAGLTGDEVAVLFHPRGTPIIGTSIGVAGTVVDVLPGGCVTDLPSLWTAIITDVGIYVNIPSDINPNGEIRADLGPSSRPTYTPSMSPTASPVVSPGSSFSPTTTATTVATTDMPTTTNDDETPTNSPVSAANGIITAVKVLSLLNTLMMAASWW